MSRAPITRGAEAPTTRDVPKPETHGHIPRSMTPSDDLYGEEPCGAPIPGVSRTPTARGAYGLPPGSVTPPLEWPYGEDCGAPLPGVSRAPTARGVPGITPQYLSGPGALDYDDAERAQQKCFRDLERQMADAAQEAAESEMPREHEYLGKEADWDRHFKDSEDRRCATLTRQPVPLLHWPKTCWDCRQSELNLSLNTNATCPFYTCLVYLKCLVYL